MMDGWIAPNVAQETRVCTYDRVGRGWSESSSGPQDGAEVATDLHTLLENAGIEGPYVLAGHSAGGAYVLIFANLYPDDLAGLVLLDSMSPDQYEEVTNWKRFYEMWRRVSALAPSVARVGVMRLIAQVSYGGLPSDQRDQERALTSTARHWRSQRDEFSKIRTSLEQAGELKSIGAKPLVVLTAEKDAEGNWMPLQEQLATLSSNSEHRVLPDATHASLTEEEEYAMEAAQAIRDVVDAVRSGTALKP
jgi:pimeloyl-ACP methyl ester carboxylesterase